ncbi:MAG: hypothetical protein R3C58_00265 [Parvularculaceae bacterium]
MPKQLKAPTDQAPGLAEGSKSFFYVERDDNQRSKWVKLHRLGTDLKTDKIVYEEPDDAYFLNVGKSQSGDYIFISSGNHVTSDVRFLRADAPDAAPELIAPREPGRSIRRRPSRGPIFHPYECGRGRRFQDRDSAGLPRRGGRTGRNGSPTSPAARSSPSRRSRIS